jgi:hypothetical protein
LTKLVKEELPFQYPFYDSYACLMINNDTHGALIMAFNNEEYKSYSS